MVKNLIRVNKGKLFQHVLDRFMFIDRSEIIETFVCVNVDVLICFIVTFDSFFLQEVFYIQFHLHFVKETFQ